MMQCEIDKFKGTI